MLSRKLVAEAQKAAEGRVELQERVAEVTTLEAERQRDSLELLRLRSDVGVMERDRQRLKAQVRATIETRPSASITQCNAKRPSTHLPLYLPHNVFCAGRGGGC